MMTMYDEHVTRLSESGDYTPLIMHTLAELLLVRGLSTCTYNEFC